MSEQLAPERDAAGRFVPSPSRSPERTALAETIARRTAAEARVQRIEAALVRAGEMARATYAAEDRAAAALAEAREAEPHWMADALLADREPGTSPLRAAETALASAREQREAARDASAVLRQQLEQERGAIGYVHPRVRRAAAAVLATSPAIEAAVERLERAEAELVMAGDAVRWLAAAGVVGVRTPVPNGIIATEDESPHEQRARQALRRLDVPPSGWLRDRPAATEGWETALAALEMDADAAVP